MPCGDKYVVPIPFLLHEETVVLLHTFIVLVHMSLAVEWQWTNSTQTSPH